MLEDLIKTVGKTLTALALASTMLIGSGCSTYKTLSPQSIKAVEWKPSQTEINKHVNYDAMTWQEAIKYVETPEEAQDYLDRHFQFDDLEEKGLSFFIFNASSKGESFKYNHTKKKGVCLDYATAAAALLSDNGYPPLVLCIEAKNPTGGKYKHGVFLHHQESGFGAIGNTPIEPRYATIPEMVVAMFQKNNPRFTPLSYAVMNLDDQWKRDEWISGDVDMQKVGMDKWIAIEPR